MKKNLCWGLLSLSLLGLCISCGATDIDLDAAYQAAVEDATIAEQSEIMPLVKLLPNDDLSSYKDGRYEMITLHKYPDSYPKGTDVTLSYGYVWVSTLSEFKQFAKSHEATTDWTIRLKQLLGVPSSSVKTHLTTMMVDVDDMIRPAYSTDVTGDLTSVNYQDMDESDEYKTWFDQQTLASYYRGSSYPWTRLGYTYDWAPGTDDYGLSEFIIANGSTVHVSETSTIDDFMNEILA